MPPKKTKSSEKEDKKSAVSGKYTEAVGRRKTAVARVRVFSSKNAKGEKIEVTVNEKDLDKYFPLKKNQNTVKSPFKTLSLNEYSGAAKVEGGGVSAQAEAIRLGFARALVAINPLWRPSLKSLGYLKRDPRMVERKKYGLRKARRPQQWRKR